MAPAFSDEGGREHQWAPGRTRAPHRILREIERSPQLVGRGPPVQALRRRALLIQSEIIWIAASIKDP